MVLSEELRMKNKGCPVPRTRGSIIIVVLVTLLLASFMIMKFMEASSLDLLLAARKADRHRLRDDAYAALELTLAVMAEVKAIDGDKLYAPAQGWADPYTYAGLVPREGVTVEITFEDESGKLSLPKIDQNKLILFCEKQNMLTRDAQRFADAWLAWTKADHNALNFDSAPSVYEREPLPHKVPQRSPRSWDEVAAIAIVRDYLIDAETGRLTPFGEVFQDSMSLYSFGSTNINSARPGLLTMAGMDEYQIQRLQQFNDGTTPPPSGTLPFFRDVKEAARIAQGYADYQYFGAEIRCLRVLVTVREGVAVSRLQVLLALEDGVSLPDITAAPSTSTTATGYWGNTSTSTTATNANASGSGNSATGAGGGRNTGGRNTGGSGNTANSGATRGGTGTASNSGRATTSGSSTSSSSTSEQTLNYPFTILEILEDNGPPASADENNETDAGAGTTTAAPVATARAATVRSTSSI